MIISAIKKAIKIIKLHRDPNGYARSIGVKMGKGCRMIDLQMNTFGSEPFLVTLGDNVTVSSGARFIAHDGGIHVFRKEHPDIDLVAPIVVGSNVFIGAEALILPGVIIGDNCVIGARAVVTKDIPTGSVAVGVPARPIGTKMVDKTKSSVEHNSVSIPTLSLKHNFSWTLLGNVIYAACQWGQIIVLTKLVSPAMVGKFTFAFAITAPVMMLSNLQLRAIQSTDAKHEYQFNDYFGLRLLTTAIAIPVIAGLSFIPSYSMETAIIIFLIGIAKSFESISDVLYGCLQQREQMSRIALSMIIKGVGSLLVLSIVVYFTRSVVFGVAALCIVWVLVMLTYDLKSCATCLRFEKENDSFQEHSLKELLRPKWDILVMRKLFIAALPLGLCMMLMSLNVNIPQYFLKAHHGEYNLGIYAALAYIYNAGSLIVNALGQSASPRLAKYFAINNFKAFVGVTTKLFMIGIALSVVSVAAAVICGKSLLNIIYGAAYAEQNDAFIWLMIGGGLSYITSFLGVSVTAMREFTIQLPIHCIKLFFAIILSALLIPHYSLVGAAWSLLICTLISLIAFTGVYQWKLRKARNCIDLRGVR